MRFTKSVFIYKYIDPRNNNMLAQKQRTAIY